MKKCLFVFIFFIAAFILHAQDQHTYGPVKENGFSDWIEYTSNGSSGDWDNGHKVGIWYASDIGKWDETRNIDSWQWTYNDIPTIATVTSVRIRFRAIFSNYTAQGFEFSLHKLKGSDSVNLYNAFNSSNQVFKTTTAIPQQQNGYIYFDSTFYAGTALCDSINNSVKSGLYYFILGIKIEGNSIPDGWWQIMDYSGHGYDGNPAIDLTINYSTPLQNYQFVNNIENTGNYDSLIIKDNTKGFSNRISSGTSLGLSWNDSISARTNVLPFSVNWNSTGKTEKHDYWIVGTNNYNNLYFNFLADLNYTPSVLTAKFNSTSSATITSNLSGAIIGFKDPWFYYSDSQGNWNQTNQFYQFTPPLYIQNNSMGSYGGVFLNQGGIPPNLTPPYYSVNAQMSKTINGSSAFFGGWTATGATISDGGPNSRMAMILLQLCLQPQGQLSPQITAITPFQKALP